MVEIIWGLHFVLRLVALSSLGFYASLLARVKKGQGSGGSSNSSFFQQFLFQPSLLLLVFLMSFLALSLSFPSEWNIPLRFFFTLSHTLLWSGIIFLSVVTDPEQGGPAAGIVALFAGPSGSLFITLITQIFWAPPEAEMITELGMLVWVFLSLRWGAANASD